jgi:alpha-galactosidase
MRIWSRTKTTAHYAWGGQSLASLFTHEVTVCHAGGSSGRTLFSQIFKNALALLLLAIGTAAVAQRVLAPTPPMGWNSWDSYGLTINEAQFRENLDVFERRLKPAGYLYTVVDEGWYLENPEAKKPTGGQTPFIYKMDAHGRYVPSITRFPSADGGAGFKPLADAAHARGLKFGIHIIRGISKQAVRANVALEGSAFHAADVADTTDTCPWNPDNFGVKAGPAGQAWYDSLMAQYAGWGVDFLKVDCISAHPYKGDEIRMIHAAIVKSGRSMVLSLSPGPAPLDKGAEVAANAQLWRISDDVWDFWDRKDGKAFPQTVKAQFAVLASWVPQAKPGNWPDADMLPLGTLGPVPGYGAPRTSALNHDEQRTLMTLWSIARSPLIVGANLTQLDDWTTALLTNPIVLAMDQRGHEQKLAGQDGDLIAWTSKGENGREYLALFNVGDSPTRVAVPLRRYGFTAAKYSAKDAWEGKDLGRISEAASTIAAHGVLLLELHP